MHLTCEDWKAPLSPEEATASFEIPRSPHNHHPAHKDLFVGTPAKRARVSNFYLPSVRKYSTESLICASVSLPENAFILPLPSFTAAIMSASLAFL